MRTNLYRLFVNAQGLNTVVDFLYFLTHLLARDDVQLQLLGTILVSAIAWLTSRLLIRVGIIPLRRGTVRRFPKRYWGRLRRTVGAVRHFIYPLLSLVSLSLLSTWFDAQDLIHGLINEFVLLSIAFVGYRIVLALLYGSFPDRQVWWYHQRLLKPLFLMFVIGRLLGSVLPLRDILGLSVFSLAIPTSENTETKYVLSVGALLLATLGFYLWIVGTSALQNLLRFLLTRRERLEPSSVEASLTIGRYLALLFGVAVVTRSLGFNATTVGFITGGLSVGIGVGLQGIVSNFVSGLILLFERSIRPGDMIEVDGSKAVVKRLTIRATEVRTFDGTEIVIPNDKLINSNVHTLSKSDRLVRLDIDVGVAYGTDLRHAQEVLLEAARNHPDVLRDPAPLVLILGFGDSSINLSLKAWVGDLKLLTSSDLNLAVWEAFKREGIQIPFPQRDLHLKTEDHSTTKQLADQLDAFTSRT